KEESSKSNAVVWQSMAGSGSVVETLTLPKFEGPTPPKLSAPGGYIVDIPKGQLKTEIEKLARQPEYAYLKQLQLSKDVNWNQVQLEYQKWDYKQEGLTGAGAAIIALALAAVTGGAGAGIATALSGTVVTGTSAAMANAAFLSLATQASISL
ncbi:MAG TPA: S-layer family protein, partial [Neisseria sp.]|nr:S-layer family protein [Neisseria sp.]